MKGPWTIETPCLGIRPFTAQDGEELHRTLENDSFVRTTHEYFSTPETRKQLIEALTCGNNAEPWAVVMKESGELAGFFGIQPADDQDGRHMKALYIMRSERFEQGYASEAMQAAEQFIRALIKNSNAKRDAAQSAEVYSGYRVHGSILKRLRGISALGFTFSLY